MTEPSDADTRIATLEAATVIRVTATGFEPPLLLGAVRHGPRLLTVRLDVEEDALPAPGAEVRLTGSDADGWTGVPT
jgi:hypothetical protein